MKKLPVICFKHFLCTSPLPAAREFAPFFGCRLALSFGKAVHQPCRGVDFSMNLLRGGGE